MTGTPVRAAGGLVVRTRAKRPETLLVGGGDPRIWRIPKGIREPGEDDWQCAIREVREETGQLTAIVGDLGEASWSYEWNGIMWDKTARFFLMVPATRQSRVRDDEFDEVRWVPLHAGLDMLEYAIERDVVRAALAHGALDQWPLRAAAISQLGVIACGRSRGNLTAQGALAVSADERSNAHAGIVAVPELEPSLAPLVLRSAGLVSPVGGVTSNLAVVGEAAGKAVLCDSPDLVLLEGALRRGPVIVPIGADVTVHEPSGTLRLGHARHVIVPSSAVSRSQPRRPSREIEQVRALVAAGRVAEAVELAVGWAREQAETLAIEMRVWKIFKRDIAALWFGPTECRRFYPGWRTDDALEYAVSLRPAIVRFSEFPDDIACHARSDALPKAADAAAWRTVLSTIRHDVTVELFPEQPRTHLCWRATLRADEVALEAGVGQAMYVFEVERGHHPVSAATISGDGTITILPAPPAAESARAMLASLLNQHGARLASRLLDLGRSLNIDSVAVEGYFHPEESSVLVCDLDLPFDVAFMSS